MPNGQDFRNIGLIHFNITNELYPLLCLTSLAELGSLDTQRKEIESWFKSALISEEGFYDFREDRALAVDFLDVLLDLLDLAHVIETSDTSQDLSALSSLASCSPVADQREYIEQWFEAGMTNPKLKERYTRPEQRAKAFDLKNELTVAVEMAHFWVAQTPASRRSYLKQFFYRHSKP